MQINMHRSAGSAATGNDKVVLQISCGVSEPQISARSLKPGGVRSVQGQSNIYVGLSSGVVGHRDRFAIQPTVIPPCGTGLGREENIRDRQQDHEDNQDRRDDPSRQSGEGPFGELLQFPETKFDCQYGMFEEIEYEILNFEFPISKQFLNVSNAQCPEKGFCLPARIVTRSVSGGCKRVLTRGNPGHCQILDRRGFSSTKILAMTTTGIRLRKEGFPCLFRMPDAPENAFEKNFEIPFPKSKGFENPHDTIRSFLPPAPLQGSSLRGCNHPWQSRVLLCHAVALAEAELCHAGAVAEMGFLFFLDCFVEDGRVY